MEDDKFKDLLEDEELTALRLAALATKKKNEQNLNNAESCSALPIDSIVTAPSVSSDSQANQIPFVQSDRSAHNNYSWRKPSQVSRRRGGSFPKNNQRSNLIVISPVSLEEGRNTEEKVPALILPQHKWCNSGNEDSMSPKTLRRTGPTRFNRHASDSESSDESDYEPSDNDSGSNETVLQDEPPEHFSCLPPVCDNVTDNAEKKRRLSFQNLDSENLDKKEATSVYKSMKNSLYSDKEQEMYAVQQTLNDGGQAYNNTSENSYSYNVGHLLVAEPSDLSENIVFNRHNSIAEQRDSFTDKTAISLSQSFDNSAKSNINRDINISSHQLSDNDLRVELKKRIQRIKSSDEMIESRTYSQNNSWDRNETLQRDLTNRIEQGFKSENDDEYASSINRRSSRSTSRERSTQERFSTRNATKYDHSFSSESRNVRSSSLDRNRHTRSTSRDRRRSERSSSRDEKRHDRSSSQGKIKHNYTNDKLENLSPNRNKSEYHGRRNSYNQNFDEEKRRDWYKSSPKERSKRSSSPDRNRHGYSSSSENKHRRSTSRDRNKYLQNNIRNKQDHNTFDDKGKYYNQGHKKSTYESHVTRGKNRDKYSPNGNRYSSGKTYNRTRHERSSSHDRSRHESSRSCDSRSERSSSREKSRCSSSRERSSSVSENRYRYSSRETSSASKFASDQHKSRHDNSISERKNMQGNLSDKDLIPKDISFQKKEVECIQNSESIKDGGLEKTNVKDLHKSRVRNRLERNHSKERPHQKYNKMKNSHKRSYSRSRSNSSDSNSSSYSSSSSLNSKQKIRSVPSVIKPVLIKNDIENRGTLNENKIGKLCSSATPQSSIHSVCSKKNSDIAENKSSNIKSGHVDGDIKENKRVPVHMRLGAFPRKRVIQMPKDVEAAFVNSTSSSEDESVNTKCKRQNIRIVADVCNTKNRLDLMQQKHPLEDKSLKRPSPDIYKEKLKRVKASR